MELSNRGLITTKVGIGSFVTFNGLTIDDATGWSKVLADVGAETFTQILRIELMHDPDLAGQLCLDEDLFIAVDRLRLLAKEARPISIKRSRLPFVPELENIPIADLRSDSLSKTLREAGLIVDSGDEWVDIEVLGEADARLLGCDFGIAFLRTRRLTRNADNRPIKYITSLLNPDFFCASSGVLMMVIADDVAVDRGLDALVGGALGDALGMPTQLLSRAEIKAHYGFVDDFVEPTPDHPVSRGLKAGSVTDDTEQTLLLASVLLDRREAFDDHQWVNALTNWEKNIKARGGYDLLRPSTKRAIDAINADMRPQKSGRYGDTNGAAIRIAPIGLLTLPSQQLIVRVAETCRATHNTNIAISSAAAVATFSVIKLAQGDAWRAVAIAANLGSYTDTIGAIAASMAGTHSGYWSLPADKIKTLVGVDLGEIKRLAWLLIEARHG